MTPYVAARAALRPVMRLIWRLNVRGSAYVPAAGPVIIACNHVSLLDPIALGTACPRPLAYMAKVELFRIPVLRETIRALGAFPVERTNNSTAAIKRSVRLLRDGQALGIFPEGRRVRNAVRPPIQLGVALIAALSGAPVVPAFVGGTGRAPSFTQIKVAFGEPLRFPQERKASRDDLAKWGQEIMERIGRLGKELDGD